MAPSYTGATTKRREKVGERKRENRKGDWLRQRALIVRQVGGADLKGRNVSVQANAPTRRASRIRRPATHEEMKRERKKRRGTRIASSKIGRSGLPMQRREGGKRGEGRKRGRKERGGDEEKERRELINIYAHTNAPKWSTDPQCMEKRAEKATRRPEGQHRQKTDPETATEPTHGAEKRESQKQADRERSRRDQEDRQRQSRQRAHAQKRREK